MPDIPYTEPATQDKFRPEQLDGMTRVTQDEFFAYVGPRDIIVTDKWNKYFCEFKTRSGDVVGRVYDQQKYRFGPGFFFLKKGLA